MHVEADGRGGGRIRHNFDLHGIFLTEVDWRVVSFFLLIVDLDLCQKHKFRKPILTSCMCMWGCVRLCLFVCVCMYV